MSHIYISIIIEINSHETPPHHHCVCVGQLRGQPLRLALEVESHSKAPQNAHHQTRPHRSHLPSQTTWVAQRRQQGVPDHVAGSTLRAAIPGPHRRDEWYDGGVATRTCRQNGHRERALQVQFPTQQNRNYYNAQYFGNVTVGSR